MKKAFVFDFDDTLAVTDCRVVVRDVIFDSVVRYLSPSDFNVYKLKDDEYYDFSEFRDGDYVKKANATFLIHLAREVYNEGHKVYILTARDMAVIDAIYVWMQSHGITVDTIHCVGGVGCQIAERKKNVLLDIVLKHDKVYFYDDSEENVNIFQHEKLRAYQV